MRADNGGVGIEYDLHGPGNGPTVLLLHGFPDTGRMWAKQVPALVEAGLRVVVMDQRGYGRSDRPASVADYHMVHLSGDVVAVLDHLSVERAAIVGHDWAPPWHGRWPQAPPPASSGWWRCRSAI